MKKVVIANDHGGVEIARNFVFHLEERGYVVNWLGTKTTDAVDYPVMAEKACTEFLAGGYEFGILCCGTGCGISMCANKIHGIRCAIPQNSFAAEKAKEHNNANFISFGGRIDYQEDPNKMLDAFIDAKPSDDQRHIRRTAMMMALETKQK